MRAFAAGLVALLLAFSAEAEPLAREDVPEPLRPSPDARVMEWIDAQALETLYLSAITVTQLHGRGTAAHA